MIHRGFKRGGGKESNGNGALEIKGDCGTVGSATKEEKVLYRRLTDNRKIKLQSANPEECVPIQRTRT